MATLEVSGPAEAGLISIASMLICTNDGFSIVHDAPLPAEVGAIRSGRSTDLDLLSTLGTPILVYSGANGGVQGQLNRAANAGRVVLVVDDGRNVNIERNDEDFNRPDNLFADLDFVLEEFGDRAGVPTPIIGFAGPDDPARPAGSPDGGITITGRDESVACGAISFWIFEMPSLA